MIPALIPIILIESAILVRVGAGVGEALLAMLIANLASTLVGIPVSVVCEIAVAVLTGAAIYQGSWDSSYRWKLPVGGMVLLIPFLLLSWWIESPIATWIVNDLSPQAVDYAVLMANLVTYSILAVLVGGFLTWAAWSTWQEGNNKPVRKLPDTTVPVGNPEAANQRARLGMARLKAAETEIVRNGNAANDQLSMPLALIQDQAQEAGRAEGSDDYHDETSETDGVYANRRAAGR